MIDLNLEHLKKMKNQVKADHQRKKKELSNLISDDHLSLGDPNDPSPRDIVQSKDLRGSNARKKNKKNNAQTESKDSAKQEEKKLFDAIRDAFCELQGIKDQSLIKKMSPLEMMTKIDSLYDSYVIISLSVLNYACSNINCKDHGHEGYFKD